MAEQLGLHQSLGDRAAIDGHEGTVPAPALIVDGEGDQLLAGAALAGDHHGRNAAGRLADGVEHLEHPPAAPHEVLEATLFGELALEREVFVLQALALERLLDRQAHLVELEGLGDVVVGAELHGLDRSFGGGEGGDDEDDRARRQLFGGAKHAETVHLPHAQVGDHEVERVALHGVDGAFSAVGHRDVVAVLPERDAQQVPHAALVVDDEHARGRHRDTPAPAAAGTMSTARVPPLAPERRLTSPP